MCVCVCVCVRAQLYLTVVAAESVTTLGAESEAALFTAAVSLPETLLSDRERMLRFHTRSP